MSKMSRRIVVDASVANSAGNGTHPTSRMCREFLLDMMSICHKVVVTQAISIEWKNHASTFSVRWLAAMRAKRKLITAYLRLEAVAKFAFRTRRALRLSK